MNFYFVRMAFVYTLMQHIVLLLLDRHFIIMSASTASFLVCDDEDEMRRDEAHFSGVSVCTSQLGTL